MKKDLDWWASWLVVISAIVGFCCFLVAVVIAFGPRAAHAESTLPEGNNYTYDDVVTNAGDHLTFGAIEPYEPTANLTTVSIEDQAEKDLQTLEDEVEEFEGNLLEFEAGTRELERAIERVKMDLEAQEKDDSWNKEESYQRKSFAR